MIPSSRFLLSFWLLTLGIFISGSANSEDCDNHFNECLAENRRAKSLCNDLCREISDPDGPEKRIDECIRCRTQTSKAGSTCFEDVKRCRDGAGSSETDAGREIAPVEKFGGGFKSGEEVEEEDSELENDEDKPSEKFGGGLLKSQEETRRDGNKPAKGGNPYAERDAARAKARQYEQIEMLTYRQCREKGGRPDNSITTRNNPDPVRPCRFIGSDFTTSPKRQQNNNSRPAY